MVMRYRAFFLLRVLGALLGVPTFFAYAGEVTVGVNGGTIVHTATGNAGKVVGNVHIQGQKSGGYGNGTTCGTFFPGASISGGVSVGSWSSNGSGVMSGTATFTISPGMVGPNDGNTDITWDVHPYDVSNNPIMDVWVTVTGINGWNWQRNGHCNEGGTSPQGAATVTFSGSQVQAHFKGAVKVNCATQHALGLTINGVQVSYQVTSAFATKNNESTVQIDYTCDSNTIDCASGKPWIFSIDGAATQSGTISYASGSPTYTLNVGGKGGLSDPVFFDCAPKSGQLQLNGSVTIPPGSTSSHSLTVKVNGSQRGSAVSPGGTTANGTTIKLTQLVDNVSNGDSIEWYIDGVLAATHTVSLNCSYNAELDATFCTAVDTFSGTATANVATPTPPPPTPTQPPPTAPPQNPGYTPPPPQPTPPPPTSSGTTAGDVTVMNPQDIYQPIVDAINNKGGNKGTASRDNSATGQGANFDARGHLDDLQPQLDAAMHRQSQIKDSGVAKINALKNSFTTLPTSLGTVSTLNFGTGLFNGIGPSNARFSTLPTNVDLSPYSTGIALGRTVLLWALTIFFGFLTVRALTWTQ